MSWTMLRNNEHFSCLLIALAVFSSSVTKPTVSFLAPEPIPKPKPISTTILLQPNCNYFCCSTNFAKECFVLFSSSNFGRLVDESTNDMSTLSSNDDDSYTVQQLTIDRRPHEQRTKGPRTARRTNHAFRFLYRNSLHLHHNVTAFEYLTRFYSKTEVLEMNRTFPPLLDLNVSRHVHPKIRFLQETLLLSSSSDIKYKNIKYIESNNNSNNTDVVTDGTESSFAMNLSQFEIPPQYFGARLEKTIAPRHAFLVYNNLPHGLSLLRREEEKDNISIRLHDFLLSCRKTKQFCALCNQWRKEQEQQKRKKLGIGTKRSHHTVIQHNIEQITPKQIEAFDFIFGKGLMVAARNELVQKDNNWPLKHINITSTEILKLLIQHGANPLERDIRGVTLLHWAAGTGNLEAFKALLHYFPNGLIEMAERDSSTPLHWAAAGANSKEFGTGGHYNLCQYILSECDRGKNHSLQKHKTVSSAKDIVNQRTKDGNSPLMWAAWSGSMDTVKLMVRYRAEWNLCNRNGCTVAHWAASGGSLKVCQYLAEVVGVDFFVKNLGGNTPLTHAVAFGRVDVIQWLRERAMVLEEDNDDLIAKQLAADFASWSGEHAGKDTVRRKQVLKLFEDDYWELIGNGE
mmetsp:Transcript_51231/g.52194  ORF Transcript_51231/g.52194 Transcript_51231/m.52194 type:complete len:628 (-) Transcript_51231:210-2093(-)